MATHYHSPSTTGQPYQAQQYPPSHGQSASRASYPTFLSLRDSAWLQLKWAWRGLVDSFRWNVVISMVLSDAEIRANVYKSLLLNSLSLISIYAFDFLLAPMVQNQQKWFHQNIGWFYQVLWLFPVVGVSFYLNSSWCSIIAKRTFVLQHGNAAHQQPASYSGMLTAIATSAYRVVMVFNSAVVSFALQNVPVAGPTIGFIFLCWVDSYYCFEFVWIARGWSLAKRIRHLEERWAYYLAFGLPSAALCTFGSGLANAAIFALVFPVYIILAMDARPVPNDPYNPQPPSSESHEADSIKHPSPYVPIRLPIFALVLWLNDAIVKVISVGSSAGSSNKAKYDRAKSEDVDHESVEEGSGGDRPNIRQPSRPTRGITDRVRIGTRRKLD